MTQTRGESEQERADRNFAELLGELRVTITGVQVLFSLLLTVPFTQRFSEATELQRRVYFAALLLAAGASLALIAPVALHRLTFRQGLKPRIMRRSAALSIVGLVFLALAIAAVLLLVTDVLFGTPPALGVAGLFVASAVGLWFVPPLVERRRG